MTFLRLATLSQILIIANLILYNFILVSKSNSPVSKLFIVTRIRCVLSLHLNLRIFSGLIFCTAYNQTVDFQMQRLREELVSELGVGTY